MASPIHTPYLLGGVDWRSGGPRWRCPASIKDKYNTSRPCPSLLESQPDLDRHLDMRSPSGHNRAANMALGVICQRPEDDRHSFSKQYQHARIVGAMGGRAAEEIVCETRTTGVETTCSKPLTWQGQRVTRWGMSDRLGAGLLVVPRVAPVPFAHDCGERRRAVDTAPPRRSAEPGYDGCS